MTSLRIALDISQIVYTGTGVARFTRGLVHTILETPTPHRYTFFFSGLNMRPEPELIHKIQAAGHRYIRWYVPPRALSWLWNERPAFVPNFQFSIFNFQLPVFDVWISSDWAQPPPHIAHKMVTIVHDLVVHMHPKTVDTLILQTQLTRLARVARECSLVICDSASTSRDYHIHYPLTEARVVTMYPGVTPLSPPPKSPSVLPYEVDHRKYFVTVGKLEPRKNLVRLCEAYARYRQRTGSKTRLLIIGPRGWGDDSTTKLPEGVTVTGQVSDGDLQVLYAHALAMIMPSLYEGFGYPVVEAMHAGCPVAVSRSSSLAELVDREHGLMFDPHDVSDITNTLITLETDHKLRETLCARGHKRADVYRWDTYIQSLEHELIAL